MQFIDKLAQAQQRSGSDWALWVSPKVEHLPLAIQRFDDPYLPYMRAIYQATKDLMCAYILDFGAYLALGAAGAVALERCIDLIGLEHVAIVDGAFASARYVGLWDELAYGCDGVTLADGKYSAAYTGRPDRAAFVMSDGVPDERTQPTYWTGARMLGVGTLRVRVLPDDLLYRARSLDFEVTLREKTLEAMRAV
jgi:hypothetical protein